MSKFTLFLLVILAIIIISKFKKAQRIARMNIESQKRQSTPNKPTGQILYEKGETKVFKGEAGTKSKENKENL